MKKHEREMNKIKEQAIRHNKNIILEQEKFEKKENDNKDKIMKKYITFYWNRKGREEKKKNNFVHFNEKYDERYVRLEEIEKAHEKKQKSLMKKLLTIQTNQKENYEREKQKYENIQKKELKILENNYRIIQGQFNEIKKYESNSQGLIDYNKLIKSDSIKQHLNENKIIINNLNNNKIKYEGKRIEIENYIKIIQSMTEEKVTRIKQKRNNIFKPRNDF